MSLRKFTTIRERKNYLEEKLQKKLKAVSVYPADLESAQLRNCENMIGAVSVPLGIAGPLRVNSESGDGEYFIPLAVTEGALVASVNRGCKAVTLSGGAWVRTEYQGISRGSVFKTTDLRESFRLKQYVENEFNQLASLAQTSSGHLKLKKIEVRIAGVNVFVRFSFDTQDAMGMNMATFAAEEICREIESGTHAECVSLAGNFDTDKKPSWLNFTLGRGRQVWAETVLTIETVSNILKTTPEKIHEVNTRKNYLGSMMSGSLGFNGHFANVIAALFVATGQDIAHISEGSIGITSTEMHDNGLSVSVYLPDLPVGTVGGGTSLPSQRESLDILGLAGGNGGMNASRLAEITGAAVLAGEISLLAALSVGQLTHAHKKLARGEHTI